MSPLSSKESVVGAEEEPIAEEESAVETSLEELLQRRDRRLEVDEDVDDEEALLEAMEGRETAAEPLTVNVVPPQPTEFTCRKCFLLKHQSQLADKKKLICKDCA